MASSSPLLIEVGKSFVLRCLVRAFRHGLLVGQESSLGEKDLAQGVRVDLQIFRGVAKS